ncbi:carbon-phosphorus lyase complex subunit PhnI [Rhizobium miluonense]|uniref:Alpha-D-ribose 1-methylphosphonate 5-triphosphate synthase subunit PhnI n=1 Tax=Rhizobium miluonense TaxID=411945 RepID=A0A1C3WDR4_9HYPH|nr:carbon-phosphorus lyase complex subunit PhnI [Rhizobium miluonense]SCB37988.1 alpha-D-ribose 1-methylphosphonate 5-triphosphate synthase subunit PhnI [Rhizobium miluonense]
MAQTIKGGERAIAATHKLLAKQRRGDPSIPEIHAVAIREQLGLAVDRVMAEGSLYAPDLAALAVKQAQGDLVEAAYLLRAYRATLQRIGTSKPIDTTNMVFHRKLSTTFKNAPGGNILGATYDWTHRLLDFSLIGESELPEETSEDAFSETEGTSPITSQSFSGTAMTRFMEPTAEPMGMKVADITEHPLSFPTTRDARLQALARGDEGFAAGLAYSSLRGFGRMHPFLSDMRIGDVVISLEIPEIAETVAIGEIVVTQCELVAKRVGSGTEEDPPRFIKGYGLSFGRNERRAMAMCILDLSMRTREFGDEPKYPAQDEEFVLLHLDNLDSSGLVQHFKLPHYVDYQAESLSIAELRASVASLDEETEEEAI